MAKKKDADVQLSEMETKASVSEGAKIRALGPSDIKNGATILRYKYQDGRKTPLDIQAGMILSVGEDISQEEADRLLSLDTWKFERVSE